jgi:hypothetical protein
MRLRARIASDRPREQTGSMQGIFSLLISTPAIVSAALILMVAVSLVWVAQRNGIQTGPVALQPIKEAPPAPNQTQVVVNNHSDKASGAPSAPIELAPGTNHPDRSGDGERVKNKLAQAGIAVTDYNESPAKIIRRGEQRAGEVSLSAPLNPMVVSMQDVHGATRRISLPPVSFGAQRLVDNRVPVSFSPNSRSW